ncbi:MAG: hypothetical protein H8D97_01365 [Proteobacteria bacterium]|nr:hypothetical protein [Pseudomonadota bacterium]
MSRTIRRKNDKWEYYWVTSDYKFNDYYQARRVPLMGPERIKEINKFHADKPSGYRNAPSSFRRCLNRTIKAKEKNIVRKLCAGQIDLDSYIISSRNKNVNWLWW